MQKVNFLPKWYIQRKEKNKRKSLRIVLIILIVFNIMGFFKLIYSKNQLKIIKSNIQQAQGLKKGNNKTIVNDVENLYKFKEFYNFAKDRVIIDNIKMNNNVITMEAKLNTMEEYLDFLSSIEENKHYKILCMHKVSEINNNIQFNIDLEVIR